MSGYSDEFEKMKVQLREKGYQEKDITELRLQNSIKKEAIPNRRFNTFYRIGDRQRVVYPYLSRDRIYTYYAG